MGSKQLGADINFAWPTPRSRSWAARGAINIIYRGEIKKAEEAGEDVAAVRTKLANEYTLQRRLTVSWQRSAASSTA